MIGRADLDRDDRFVTVVRPPHARRRDNECQGDPCREPFAHDRILAGFRRPEQPKPTCRRRREAPSGGRASCSMQGIASNHVPADQSVARYRWRLYGDRMSTEAVNNSPDGVVIRPVSPPLDRGTAAARGISRRPGRASRHGTSSEKSNGKTDTWVLALVLTCAPAVSAAAVSAPQGAASVGDRRQGRRRLQRQGRARTSRRPPRNRTSGSGGSGGCTTGPSSESPKSSRPPSSRFWNRRIPKLREARQELERAEDELSRTIKEHTADLADSAGWSIGRRAHARSTPRCAC